jgi:hypothetical protein
MRSLEDRSNKELERIVNNVKKTKKLLRPTEQAINIKFWKMHAVLDRLDSSSANARRIVGLRRMGKCKAIMTVKGVYYNTFQCGARERRPSYSKDLMARSLCWSCHYTLKQAGMRKLMLKIKNGGQNNGQ